MRRISWRTSGAYGFDSGLPGKVLRRWTAVPCSAGSSVPRRRPARRRSGRRHDDRAGDDAVVTECAALGVDVSPRPGRRCSQPLHRRGRGPDGRRRRPVHRRLPAAGSRGRSRRPSPTWRAAAVARLRIHRDAPMRTARHGRRDHPRCRAARRRTARATGYHRTHVTSGLYAAPGQLPDARPDASTRTPRDLRVTLDTEDDFALIETLVAEFGDRPPSLDESSACLRDHPDVDRAQRARPAEGAGSRVNLRRLLLRRRAGAASGMSCAAWPRRGVRRARHRAGVRRRRDGGAWAAAQITSARFG